MDADEFFETFCLNCNWMEDCDMEFHYDMNNEKCEKMELPFDC
jgi:hypothetical protein